MMNAEGFAIDIDKILHLAPDPASTSVKIGWAGIQNIPVYILDGSPAKHEIKFLSLNWLRILQDPKPPARAVSFLVELTCSAYFDQPQDIYNAIRDEITPGAVPTPVRMTRIGTFQINSDGDKQETLSEYFRTGCLPFIENKALMDETTDEDGMPLWQVALVQLCLISGHLFTGNTNYYKWFIRRLTGLDLPARVSHHLTAEFLSVLSIPGGYLAIVRSMVSTYRDHSGWIPLVNAIRVANTYVEWSGMAWVYLALTLIMKNRHPILLMSCVRREVIRLSQVIKDMGPDLSKLPFQRILGTSQIIGLNAGGYPSLSSAAYGVAKATYENFDGFKGAVYADGVYKAAKYLTKLIVGLESEKIDPMTGLSGKRMQETASSLTKALQDSKGTGE